MIRNRNGVTHQADALTALRAEAYEAFATAVRVSNAWAARYSWLRARVGDDDARTRHALTQATAASLHRADARRRFRQAQATAVVFNPPRINRQRNRTRAGVAA